MLIELGIINYKLFILLIYPIFYQIRIYIHRKSNPFYILFTEFLGYLCGGLIYILIKYRMKSTKTIEETFDKRNNEKKKELEENYSSETKNESLNDRNKLRSKSCPVLKNYNTRLIFLEKRKAPKNLRTNYKFILLLSFINLIPMPLEAFTTRDVDVNFKMSSSLFYFIFFNVLFCRIILGEKIYKHHLLSLIIILLCIPLLLGIYLVQFKNRDNLNLFLNSLYLILIASLYSLFDVLAKKNYNTYMGSPYKFMFLIGLIDLTILLFYEFFTLIITGIKDNHFNGIIYQIKKNCMQYSFWYILIIILDVISSFIFLAGIQLTVYFFSPCHFIISESLSQIITTIINNSFENYNINFKISIYIIYTIIAFISFIYNEIIIINIGTLSSNTRKNIMKRELIEKDYSLNLIFEQNEERISYNDNYFYI